MINSDAKRKKFISDGNQFFIAKTLPTLTSLGSVCQQMRFNLLQLLTAVGAA